MGDDWDPFAIDEAGAAPAAPAALTAEAGEKQVVCRIKNDDIEKLAERVMARIKKDKPWCKAPSAQPDLSWHTPTCGIDDWQHHDVQMQVGRGIVYVIFNRAEQNNSMQDTLGSGINDALFALHARPDIRVAVWTGEGRMYCAGGDPKGWQAMAAADGGEYTGDGTVGVRIPLKPPTPEVNDALWHLGQRALAAGAFPDGMPNIGRLQAAKQWHTWSMLPQFTINLANGSAMGGGVGCVCCCDYVVSVKKAYFVLSEVKIGVVPATISPYVIAKLGIANSKRLFCCAENLTAERAKGLGMVQDVVESMRQGHDRVKEIVDMITECGPSAVVACKRLIVAVNGARLSEELNHFTCGVQGATAESDEYKHGMAFEKAGTTPPWKTSPIGFDKWPQNAVGLGGKGKKEE